MVYIIPKTADNWFGSEYRPSLSDDCVYIEYSSRNENAPSTLTDIMNNEQMTM